MIISIDAEKNFDKIIHLWQKLRKLQIKEKLT